MHVLWINRRPISTILNDWWNDSTCELHLGKSNHQATDEDGPLRFAFAKSPIRALKRFKSRQIVWLDCERSYTLPVYASVRSSCLKPVCGSLSQVGIYKYPITLSLGYRCRRQAGPPPIKGGWTGWLLAKRPIQSSPVRLRIKSTLGTSPPSIWALSWRNSDFRFLCL